MSHPSHACIYVYNSLHVELETPLSHRGDRDDHLAHTHAGCISYGMMHPGYEICGLCNPK